MLNESYSTLVSLVLTSSPFSNKNTGKSEHNVQTISSYSTSDVSTASISESSMSALQEQQADQRFVRFMNPVFQYDFKVGNYMPDEAKKLNPHLFMTIKDVTTGIRKSS